MSDTNRPNESNESPILGRIGNLTLAALRTLGKLPPVGQLIVFLIATGMTIYGFYKWNAMRQSALSASFAALSGKVEATGQAYKGIEALVLAGSEREPEESPKLTDEAAALFGGIITSLQKANKTSFPLAQLVAVSNSDGAYADQFLTLAEGVTLDKPIPGHPLPASEPPYAYIFVPGIALKGVSAADFHAEGQGRRSLNDNKEIVASLDTTMAIWKPVTELTGKQLFKTPASSIVQSFFLLRTGVLVIHQSAVPESQQRKHYLSQFIGHTFLPERPYFWKTIKKRKYRIQQGRSRFDLEPDYQTAPYIDLGTNGPIQTYCWGFVGNDNPGAPEGALCADVKLAAAEQTVVENLKEIGATTKPVNCDLDTSTCLYSQTKVDSALSDEARNAQKNGNGQLEVFGGIHVMPSHHMSPSPVLQFHVPLETYMKDGRRTLYLLECELDLGALQFKNDFLLILALCPLLLAIGALINLASVYAARTKQLRHAVDNIHFLLANAEEPYVLVDPDDRIINTNIAFAKLLGLSTTATLKGHDIRDFMQADSADRYNQERQKRINEEASEYDLAFLGSNEKGEPHEVKCKVYGAPLPVPREFRKNMPHSVAILIPEKRPLITRG